MTNSRIIDFYHRPPGGDPNHLGYAYFYPNLGWKFFPAEHTGHQRSRKYWDTIEGCLPRWLRYPDGCESMERERAA